MDVIFQNVGKQLQKIAKNLFFGMSIGSIIGLGITLIRNDEDWGWWVIIFGPLICYLLSLLLYGFGVIVENAENAIHAKGVALSDASPTLSSPVDQQEQE